MKKSSRKILTLVTLSAVLITAASAGVFAIDNVADKTPTRSLQESSSVIVEPESDEIDFVYDPTSDKSPSQQLREANLKNVKPERDEIDFVYDPTSDKSPSQQLREANLKNVERESDENENVYEPMSGKSPSQLLREANLNTKPKEVVLTEQQLARLEQRGDLTTKAATAQVSTLSSILYPQYHEYEYLTNDNFMIESLVFSSVNKEGNNRELISAYVNFNFFYNNGTYAPEFPINRPFYCYSELEVYCNNSSSSTKISNRSDTTYTAQQASNAAIEYSHLYDLSGFSNITKISFNLYLIDATNNMSRYTFDETHTIDQILAK